MTENNRNACMLMLSVVLLTCTVTEVVQPLRQEMLKMDEQARYAKKEIVVYRKFLHESDRKQRLMQQQIALQRLKDSLPERPEENGLADWICRTAKQNGVIVRQMKRVAVGTAGTGRGNENSSDEKKIKNGTGIKSNGLTEERSITGEHRIRRFAWDTEFAGTWWALMEFIRDIETQDPISRLETVQVRRGKDLGLTLRARINIYYFPGTERRCLRINEDKGRKSHESAG